jgi:Transcriptional Coactivator p15 (PC4)
MQHPTHEWSRWNHRPAHDASGEVGRLSTTPKWTDSAAGMQGISPRQGRPPCSKCHGEPRYPGQRWGPRCFARYHANRRARRRREREAGPVRDKATIFNTRRRYNTPPPLFEQLKRVVLEVPKYRNRPETIRISLLPYRAHMYVDVRTYLKGKPTRKGITIHSDLVPAVMEGMQRALHTWWDDLPRQWEREPGPTRWQTGVTWPDHLG